MRTVSLVDVLGGAAGYKIVCVRSMAVPRRHTYVRAEGRCGQEVIVAAVKEHGEAQSEEAQLNGAKEQGKDAGAQLVLEDAGDSYRSVVMSCGRR